MDKPPTTPQLPTNEAEIIRQLQEYEADPDLTEDYLTFLESLLL